MFSDAIIQKIAAKTNFYKRKSGFTPVMFFDLLLYTASVSHHCSLDQMSSLAHVNFGVNITKQSIDERFNQEAVIFVKQVLKELLEIELGKTYDVDFLTLFNHVRVKDSTRFNIPHKLTKWYKGTGGNSGSDAGICIQYEYDIKSGKILDLEITPSSVNDATNAKCTRGNIEPGDLVIRDLGYYNLDVLQAFENEGAYFISKLNTTSKIFDVKTKQEISIRKLHDKMKKDGLNRLDLIVLVSAGKKKKLRLIVDIVPDQVYEKRLRKVNKYNKENGYKTSGEYKSRARLNMYITNIDKDTLEARQIFLLYRLRWQIELMFKNWKSLCNIHKTISMKYERFTCYIYTKMILIVLKMQIFWALSSYFYQKSKKILSAYKCFKTLNNLYEIIYQVIKGNKKESGKATQRIRKVLSKNHWKEKRKDRNNYEEIMNLFLCKSNDYKYISKEKGDYKLAS